LPQPQWNAPPQGWRSPYNNSPTLLPSPPTQPQILHSAPPKQPQILAQPNPNLNNKQAHQVYSRETSYPTYAVEIQETNLRFGRVLPDNQPLPPPREVEDEREESMPKVNPPPFLKRLTQPLQPTPEETKLLVELKNLCVKIPLLQAIKYVPFTTI